MALFRGLVFGQVGLESCWGLAVSALCRTEAGAATEGAINTAPSTTWFLHGFFMALDGSFDVGHFMSDFILDVGHVICCCSAVSAADRQRLWKLIQLLIHSVGNVSALFVESCCYSAVVRVGCFL